MPEELAEDESRLNPLSTFLPTGALGAAFVAAAVTCLIGVATAKASTAFLDSYGFALFLGLPFACGFTSAFLYSLRQDRGLWSCLAVNLLSFLFLGAGLTACAVDGLICLLMAAPLAFVVSIPGSALGYFIAGTYREERRSGAPLASVLLVLPLAIGVESKLHLEPPVNRVVTTVDIQAPPGTVWKHVVTFPPIPEPTEFVFRTGIAYPQNATIVGRGVGAVRYCNFSTGPFVEPIRVWDEPHLLGFDVTHNPAPLREVSFYRNLQPSHLHDFMVSRHGQFRLIRLNAHTTRLEGTTWYQHRLWPAWYWKLYSDTIIHKIHHRVLDHIKEQAEHQS